jgi:hypothetical protein
VAKNTTCHINCPTPESSCVDARRINYVSERRRQQSLLGSQFLLDGGDESVLFHANWKAARLTLASAASENCCKGFYLFAQKRELSCIPLVDRAGQFLFAWRHSPFRLDAVAMNMKTDSVQA